MESLPKLVESLLTLWPLWTIVLAILSVRRVVSVVRKRWLARTAIDEIDKMNGPTFERRLALLFEQLGFEAEVTGSRGEYGCDLVVSKDGRRYAVQVKRSNGSVGVQAVQAVVASRPMYAASGALVATNSHFTPRARKLAAANDVELWDREMLNRLLTTQDGAVALAMASGESVRGRVESPFCARCGTPVSDHVREYCLEHRGWFAGLVYCDEHQLALR